MLSEDMQHAVVAYNDSEDMANLALGGRIALEHYLELFPHAVVLPGIHNSILDFLPPVVVFLVALFLDPRDTGCFSVAVGDSLLKKHITECLHSQEDRGIRFNARMKPFSKKQKVI